MKGTAVSEVFCVPPEGALDRLGNNQSFNTNGEVHTLITQHYLGATVHVFVDDDLLNSSKLHPQTFILLFGGKPGLEQLCTSV